MPNVTVTNLGSAHTLAHLRHLQQIKERVPGWCDRVLCHSLMGCRADVRPEKVGFRLSNGALHVTDNYRSVNRGAAVDISDHSPVASAWVVHLQPPKLPAQRAKLRGRFKSARPSMVSTLKQGSVIVCNVLVSTPRMTTVAPTVRRHEAAKAAACPAHPYCHDEHTTHAQDLRALFPLPFEDGNTAIPDSVRGDRTSDGNMVAKCDFATNLPVEQLHLAIRVKLLCATYAPP